MTNGDTRANVIRRGRALQRDGQPNNGFNGVPGTAPSRWAPLGPRSRLAGWRHGEPTRQRVRL